MNDPSSKAATLRYSYPQIELFSEITENFKDSMHGAATFPKLLLIMENLFEHLPDSQKDFKIPQMSDF